MGRRAPLTDEMVRILRAAERGNLFRSIRTWRWQIEGQLPPDSRARKLLLSRGYLGSNGSNKAIITGDGRRALAEYEAATGHEVVGRVVRTCRVSAAADGTASEPTSEPNPHVQRTWTPEGTV